MQVPMIEFQNVSKVYEEHQALCHINLRIDKGEFITVIGTSGSGKTTLLKSINGLIMPSSGRVLINGTLLDSSNMIDIRREIGYVIQGGGLFPHLSVYENIAFPLTLREDISTDSMKDRVLHAAGLAHLDQALLTRRIQELSGGQQQRVGIARALVGQVPLMLMDEPFGALDDITRRKLQKEIHHLAQETGVTVVFVTHDIREAMILGDRILVMDAGHIVQDGRPGDILEHPATTFVRELIEPILYPMQ